MIVKEGKVKIFAPNVNLKGPGKIEGIFYNRAMIINRDSTVFLLYNLNVKSSLDGLAATGIRGLRIKKENEIEEVTINDINKKAVETIIKNAEMNNLDVEITNKNVNSILSEKKYDYVDIDPFGTPVYFIDSSLRSSKILGVTATDTATLGGRNSRVRRRYLADVHSESPISHEIGIRVLLGYVGRMAVRFDLGIKPIFSMWHGHFYRVYIRILKGVAKAKETMKNIGTYKNGGPLWLSDIHDFEFLNNARIPEWIPQKKKLEKYIEIWKNEKFFLFYYIPNIASDLKCSTPSPNRIIEDLRNMGYEAYKTQFSPQGIRTNADRKELERLICAF